MCIREGCANWDYSWRRELFGASDENGWVSEGLLSEEVRHLVANGSCGYPHWFPKKHGFLADPVKQAVNGEDWLWCVGTKLTSMTGFQLSCPYSSSAPAWFRPKLARNAQHAIDALEKGYDAKPYEEGRYTKTKWSDQLYKADSELKRYHTYTRVTQGSESGIFNTKDLMSLVGGIPPAGGVVYSGIGPTKVYLTFISGRLRTPAVSAARPGTVRMITGFPNQEKQLQKNICAEICLDEK